jgi:uncharacterized protein YdhG (YjbR/CyaY superfamily)
MTKPADIDAYIAGLSEEARPIAEAIRRTIRTAAPASGEKLSYGIPAFVIDGRNFLYFAMWKKHVGLYPIYRGDAAYEEALAPYRAKTDTVQFMLHSPIPHDLIGRIVESQLSRQN